MAQRIALGFLMDKILKEVTTNINEEHRTKIETDVDKRLITIFGSDWSRLPITGPRMMAMVLVLNIVLLPFGIVPAALFEVAITKSKEHGAEEKFLQLMQNAKQQGEDSKVKFAELIDYAGEAGKNVKGKLNSLSQETGSILNRFFDKRKNLFGKIGKSRKDS